MKGGSLRVWVYVVFREASTGGGPLEIKRYDFKVKLSIIMKKGSPHGKRKQHVN